MDYVASFHPIYTALTYLGYSLARDAAIISRRNYANSIGYPSESASSSKWHAWFTSRCPGRRLSTWPTTWRLVSDSTRRSRRSADVSTCVVPPTLSSYGVRTFAAAGPRLWNSLPVQLRNPDITYGLFRRQLKEHLSPGSMNTALCDF